MFVRMDLSLILSKAQFFSFFFEQKNNKIFKSRGLSRSPFLRPCHLPGNFDVSVVINVYNLVLYTPVDATFQL